MLHHSWSRSLASTRARIAGASLLALLAALPAPCSAEGFNPASPPPFPGAERRKIDDICGPKGAGSAKSKLQNARKNALDALGPVIRLTDKRFKQLQDKIELMPDLVWGSPTSIPSDRTRLVKVMKVGSRWIGEGTLVSYRGYLIEGHYSNVDNGENVNCSQPDEENNDIHIALAADPDATACYTLTAEMIPHYRPDAWTEESLELVRGRPVRVTGHLFFDASHRPCKNGHGSPPRRFTSWEIHPVYDFEVCADADLANCPESDDPAVWSTLATWVEDKHFDMAGLLEPETELEEDLSFEAMDDEPASPLALEPAIAGRESRLALERPLARPPLRGRVVSDTNACRACRAVQSACVSNLDSNACEIWFRECRDADVACGGDASP